MADSSKRVRNVRPDALDFRDLPFRPNVAVPPQPQLLASIRQRRTGADRVNEEGPPEGGPFSERC